MGLSVCGKINHTERTPLDILGKFFEHFNRVLAKLAVGTVEKNQTKPVIGRCLHHVVVKVEIVTIEK